ncbi:MAG: TIGR04255 family protein [Polyangiaceae bacterium]
MSRRLKDPPIVEVVCGFFFSPLARLDPITVGKYWSEKKERAFPKTQLQPPVADRPGVRLGDGIGPLRCWLIGEHDEYLLQIQPDRFYFNWRKREGEYPHFNDYGEKTGVLSRSLAEFEQFAEFASAALGQTPKPGRLELAKIDLLTSPKHWEHYSDLQSVLPMLGKLPKITEDPSVTVSFEGEREGFQLQFGLTNAVLAPDMSAAVQIETRVTTRHAVSDDRETFVKMNALANQVFFESLADAEYARFGGLIE